MIIWTENEIKRAHENMVYAQAAFNKFPSKQTWCGFCNACKTWTELHNQTFSKFNMDVLYANKWLDI